MNRRASVLLALSAAVATCNAAFAEVLRVKIDAQVFAQVSLLVGDRVVVRTNWIRPGSPAVSLPCDDFPCTVRVRWGNGTIERFGPVEREVHFQGKREFLLRLKPVFEQKTEMVFVCVWDCERQCWRRERREHTSTVTHFVPEFTIKGYLLDQENNGKDHEGPKVRHGSGGSVLEGVQKTN